MKRRRIAVVIGSRSDLPQCEAGMRYLKEQVDAGYIEVPFFDVMSVHRNTDELLTFLRKIDAENSVDCLATVAGWANHLTGTVDAYLRKTLGNTTITVGGVAIEDSKNKKHTEAACLSISEVPGTQVIFSDERGQFIGSDGFLRMCKVLVEEELPALTAGKQVSSHRGALPEAFSLLLEM